MSNPKSKVPLRLSEKMVIMGLIYLGTLVIFSSCQKQEPISEAKGNIKVLVPIVGEGADKLSNVTIKNVNNLKEVSGSYAQFYYTPGSQKDSLTGQAPQARFIRTTDEVYVPTDVITQQMFSIYYHIQNLNDFNAEIASELKQTKPFSIGLNTQVSGDLLNGINNAFFDGQSNALLVVPYSLKNVPISVNGGIIAHEFFHSVFFKYMFKNFTEQQAALVKQSSGDDAGDMDAFYYNQTYIRGINEGMADFWGWIYTNNTDYISISLPDFGEARKMELDDAHRGQIETRQDIEAKVAEAQALSRNPTDYLSGYIYKVGTPHARFLKELTVKIARDNYGTTEADLAKAKLKIAQSIFSYLKFLSRSTSAFAVKDTVAADNLFAYMAQEQLSGLTLSVDQCDFVLQYVDVKNQAANTHLCKGSHEEKKDKAHDEPK